MSQLRKWRYFLDYFCCCCWLSPFFGEITCPLDIWKPVSDNDETTVEMICVQNSGQLPNSASTYCMLQAAFDFMWLCNFDLLEKPKHWDFLRIHFVCNGKGKCHEIGHCFRLTDPLQEVESVRPEGCLLILPPLQTKSIQNAATVAIIDLVVCSECVCPCADRDTVQLQSTWKWDNTHIHCTGHSAE